MPHTMGRLLYPIFIIILIKFIHYCGKLDHFIIAQRIFPWGKTVLLTKKAEYIYSTSTPVLASPANIKLA